MEYHCISADSHIDLNWLPYDLFVSSASAAMKDRMPYVTQTADGPKWVTKSGEGLGFANGKGGTGVTGAGRKVIPGKEHRLDRIASTGLYTDGMKGIFRPTTPELRLQDQDRDGIQAEVLFGLHGTGGKMKDHEAIIEFYRIYNDWLSDFCSYDKQRFIGLASIPSHTVEAAVAETRRVAKLGLGGIDFLAFWDMIPLWHPYWEPFWKTAAEVNLPVHFHTVSSRPWVEGPGDAPDEFKAAGHASKLASSQVNVAGILSSIIHSGALERYPNLRVVFGECGIGWIPYVLERMDMEYEGRFKGRLPLKNPPSYYWHRQCRATFQEDPVGTRLVDLLGEENIMWASDYPHADGVFPDSQEYIKKQFSHLPEATQHKIICENVGKFYGLM